VVRALPEEHRELMTSMKKARSETDTPNPIEFFPPALGLIVRAPSQTRYQNGDKALRSLGYLTDDALRQASDGKKIARGALEGRQRIAEMLRPIAGPREAGDFLLNAPTL